MSMQIEFDSNYYEETTYMGLVNKLYGFKVKVIYRSSDKKWNVQRIIWLNKKPEDSMKTEARIKHLVMKWHYGNPEHKEEENESNEKND